MSDYSKGKVYKVINNVNDEVYVGSTINSLTKRFTRHKTLYRLKNNGGKTFNYAIFTLFDKYGVDNCQIVLIEDYPCQSLKELTYREQHWMNQLKIINQQPAHHINTKQRIQEKSAWARLQVKCDCGDTISHRNLARHKKSLSHQNNIDELSKGLYQKQQMSCVTTA